MSFSMSVSACGSSWRWNVKIRSPKVGEFMRFINENPFCTTRQVIDHFIAISREDEKRQQMDLRPLNGHWRVAYDGYKLHSVWVGARAQASSYLSYLLYFYNSHLLEGSRNLKGAAQVRYVPREDGKMGYVLTPAGMGSLASWLTAQKPEVSQPV